MSDVVRIGKVQEGGHELIILELFGVPLAHASTEKMIEDFDRDPVDFVQFWSEYFRRELVSMVAEDMQQNRRIQGWGMATRLAPRLPSLPPEEVRT
jgi:hypothetical protein